MKNQDRQRPHPDKERPLARATPTRPPVGVAPFIPAGEAMVRVVAALREAAKK